MYKYKFQDIMNIWRHQYE